MRIIKPPKIRMGVMVSSRMKAARTTVTTGSMVESVEAITGPTRSRPARNVTTAKTVETRATALAENPAGVLASYDLTPEHRKALIDGDIASIEKWVGPLEERMQVWLKARLKQENISEKQASGI